MQRSMLLPVLALSNRFPSGRRSVLSSQAAKRCAPARAPAVRFSPTPERAGCSCDSTAQPFQPVCPLDDRFPPVAVLEVPRHGCAQAIFEGALRSPAQLPADLRAIDGIAPVVTGTVRHGADERIVRRS